jgi:glycosyltransferase involved in cell wall biosynthesis
MTPVTASPAIAILIPCLNEELTIGKVIKDFQAELPQATIYVFDNDSTDRTAAIAQAAGAVVIMEKRRGKGFVIQSMFKKVNADIYIMVDGDDTYPAEQVHALLAPVLNDGFDMSVGSRIVQGTQSGFRPLNWLGNLFYQYVVNLIFKAKLTDILSGYRCMNYNFVKGLPIFVTGFEVETELTIKALERGFQIIEVPVELRSRPEGSHSKIRIVHDGLKILWTIFALFRDYKPFTFFGVIGLMFIIVG